MLNSIMPYQSGGDLVFALYRGDTVARWITDPQLLNGGVTWHPLGQIVTAPTIALANMIAAHADHFYWSKQQ